MAIVKKTSSNIFTKFLITALKRFHFIIFFVFVVACLSVAVVLINQVLTKDSAGSNNTTSNSGNVNSNGSNTNGIDTGASDTTIDQATLDRIQSLHKSSSSGSLPKLPSGRINPFSE